MEKRGLLLVVSIAFIVLLLNGCSQKAKVDEQVLNDLETKGEATVSVTVKPTVSEKTVQELQTMGLAATGNGTFIGKISFDQLEKLKKTEQLTEVSKAVIEEKQEVPQRRSGPYTIADEERTYDRLRAEQSITVGPYINPEVILKLEREGRVQVAIIFRSSADSTVYYDYFLSINRSMSENELYVEESELRMIGRGFRATINKNGLNKLKNNSHLLRISPVLS